MRLDVSRLSCDRTVTLDFLVRMFSEDVMAWSRLTQCVWVDGLESDGAVTYHYSSWSVGLR